MFGLFGKRKPLPKVEGGKKEETPVLKTASGALIAQKDDSLEMLKGLVESAAMNQPQLAEHVTAQISSYITDAVSEPFQEIFRTVLHPAVLLGDATGKELGDILTELYVKRLRFSCGPRFLVGDLSSEFDLQYTAAQPILRLAKHSHLLHVSLRYGPIKMDEEGD